MYNKKLNRIIKYGGNIILITTITEKKFYTHEDLLVAISKLPEKEAENILINFKLSSILSFMNFGNESKREEWKNSISETLHKELDIYNGFNRLYEMLPVIENKICIDEGVVQNSENVSSESELEDN